jgi:ring-1,2-phenylacetyl-CoA epoxidase subunit PaaD
MAISSSDIMGWLQAVKDPEIPVLSLVDLGIVKNITIDGVKVTICITPTFVGCPALEMMKSEIIEVLQDNGIQNVEVIVSYKIPWTSDDITENGKIAIKKFGLAPPPHSSLFIDLDILEYAVCPRCNKRNTELKSHFGATLCRSIHFCHDCKEAFEQFKPL